MEHLNRKKSLIILASVDDKEKIFNDMTSGTSIGTSSYYNGANGFVLFPELRFLAQ